MSGLLAAAPTAGGLPAWSVRTASMAAATTAIPADTALAMAAATNPSTVTPPPRSYMNDASQRVERRLGDRLGERRVGVNREIDFLDGVLVLARDRQFVDQFRSVAAHDMGA